MALTAKQMDEYEKVKKEFGSVSKEQLKEIKNKSGGSNKKKKKPVYVPQQF
jgi:hypothetical protein